MYKDKDLKKAHLIDFKRVLTKLEKQESNEHINYRIKVIKECIERCSKE